MNTSSRFTNSLVLSFLTLAAGGSLHAGIINGSFEIPDQGTGFTQGVITGWTGSPGQNYYFGVTGEAIIPQPFPDGDQAGYVNNFANLGGPGTPSSHSIAQQLSDVLLPNTPYTLSAYFGWRTDNGESTGGLELWAGGTVANGLVSGGVLLASTSVSLTQGAWVLGTVGFTASNLDPNLGQQLSVRLVGTPNGNYFAQTDFDDVQLTTPSVPDAASTLALLAFSVFGLSVARHRVMA